MTTTTATDEDVMVHHADCADWAHDDYDACTIDSWTDGQPMPDASYTLTANPSQECGPLGRFYLAMEATDAGDLDEVLEALEALTRHAESLKRRMAV